MSGVFPPTQINKITLARETRRAASEYTSKMSAYSNTYSMEDAERKYAETCIDICAERRDTDTAGPRHAVALYNSISLFKCHVSTEYIMLHTHTHTHTNDDIEIYTCNETVNE